MHGALRLMRVGEAPTGCTVRPWLQEGMTPAWRED
jgi:hypothetical protein